MSAADTASAGTYTSMALMPTSDTRPGRRYASLPGSAAAASIIGSAATASDHTAELPASPLASAGGAGASGAGAGVMRRRRWLASAAGDERDGRHRPRGRACRLRSDRRYAEGRVRWGRGGAPWGGSHRRGRNERRCRCGRAGRKARDGAPGTPQPYPGPMGSLRLVTSALPRPPVARSSPAREGVSLFPDTPQAARRRDAASAVHARACDHPLSCLRAAVQQSLSKSACRQLCQRAPAGSRKERGCSSAHSRDTGKEKKSFKDHQRARARI